MSQFEDFIKAVITADFDRVNQLLDAKEVDINEADEQGMTALIHAAAQKNVSKAMISLLLKRGADIYQKDHLGNEALSLLATALAEDKRLSLEANILEVEAPEIKTAEMKAAENLEKRRILRGELTAELIQEIQNKNFKDRDNATFAIDLIFKGANVATAMLYCIKNLNEACYLRLMFAIARSMSFKQQRHLIEALYDGKTLLMYAAARGLQHVVAHLLLHGSHVERCDSDGRRALIYAIENGHANVVLLFIDKMTTAVFKLDETSDYIETFFGYKSSSEVTYVTMEAGKSPLLYAASIKDIDRSNLIVKHLIDAGAYLRCHDHDHKTLLMYIVERGVILGKELHRWQDNILNAINTVLIGQAQINDSTLKEGKTALMFAQKNCDYFAIKGLLDNGAKINDGDFVGKTALMYAMERGDEAIIKLLIQYKADVRAKDKNGNTARDYLDKTNPNAAQLLKLIPLPGISATDFKQVEAKQPSPHAFYRAPKPLTEANLLPAQVPLLGEAALQ